MSDFLGNLIATHLLQANVLQPQRPSLFEPSSLAAGSLAEVTDEVLAPPSVMTPRMSENQTPPLPHQADEPITPNERPASHARSSSIEPTMSQPTVTRVSTKLESAQHETHTQAERVNEATTTQSIVVAPAIRSGNETLPAREASAPRTANAIHSAPRIRSTIEPAAPATPTVNVTIGRLEVRATTTTTPVRETRRASKVMSLEDYLQQRNREARP